MSVKCILQGQSQSAEMKYKAMDLDKAYELLPEIPAKPVQAGEEIPYSWEQINAIAVTDTVSNFIEVGAIKSVHLDYPILGLQDIKVRYIGPDAYVPIDEDSDKIPCMVFQADFLKGLGISYATQNTREDTVAAPQGWKNSKVRQECQELYQVIPFKNYIRALNKGTCCELDGGRDAKVAYNKELIWLLSEQEIGGNDFSPLDISNVDEKWGEATYYIMGTEPYEYYTVRENREMGFPYWLRSSYFETFDAACIVSELGEFNFNDVTTRQGFLPAFAIGVIQGNIVQDDEDITSKVSDALGLSQHIANTGNPHNVTAFQIGAVPQEDFTNMGTIVSNHINNTNNPHKVTATQLGAALSTDLKTHTSDSTIHVTSTEKNKIAKAVTTSGVVYNSALPAKPSTPIATGKEIPYSWDELNAIALSGKATDYVSVGAIKSVTLTSAVLGTTTHDVRIIGINQDNDQSITFQTIKCLTNSTVFSNSSAQWIGSIARSLCQNYYNAFPGKTVIKTVKKGTCANLSSSRNGSVTYNDETVWLPSEREMGLDSYSPLSVANSSTSKAECTQGKNFSYTYYTSNSSRTKNNSYWNRSRDYGSGNSYSVCIIYGAGYADYGAFGDDYGLAPAFVIGNEESLSKGTLTQDGEDITEKIKEIVSNDNLQNPVLLKHIETSSGATSINIDVSDIDFDNYYEVIMYTNLFDTSSYRSSTPMCDIRINNVSSTKYGFGQVTSGSSNLSSTKYIYQGPLLNTSKYSSSPCKIYLRKKDTILFVYSPPTAYTTDDDTYILTNATFGAYVLGTSNFSSLQIDVTAPNYATILAGSTIEFWGQKK